MCLGVPGRVVEADELTALVDFWGVRRRVRLDLVDEPVRPGDYVLNHVGFAIRRIPPADVTTTLELYEQLLRENTGSGPEDLMAADVRAEIASAQERLRPCEPEPPSRFALRWPRDVRLPTVAREVGPRAKVGGRASSSERAGGGAPAPVEGS